jgi:RNA polymerase sigma-70 factor, ECF subfamily
MANEFNAPRKRSRPSHCHAASGGSSRDFEEFYRLHRPGLRSLAVRRTRNPAEAEDLVQETFERALKAFRRLRPDSNEMGWLATIMNRLFVDRCRRSRRFRPSRHDSGDDLAVALENEPEAWWQSLTLDDVKQALAELPVEWREIYERAVLQGQSYKEIAASKGLVPSSVGSRLHRVRAKLRDLLMSRQPTGSELQGC